MKIRNTEEIDLEEIYQLCIKNKFLDETYSKSDFINTYRCLYFDNYQKEHFELSVEIDNKIIAHTGMVPFPFKFQDKSVIAGLGANLIVDEDHRKGLAFFALKGKYLREYAKKSGISFTYGIITRPGVLEAHLKLGYVLIGEIPVLARPYKSKKLVAEILKSKLLATLLTPFTILFDQVLKLNIFFGSTSNIVVEKISKFDESITKLSEQITANFKYSAIRNVECLNWRYNSFPHRGYQKFGAYRDGKLLGYIALRVMKMKEFSSIALVDLFCAPDDKGTAKVLMAKMHELALKNKVDLASTVINPNSKFSKYFKSFGFIKTPEVFTVVANCPKKSDIKLDKSDFKEWHFTWFDHDYV